MEVICKVCGQAFAGKQKNKRKDGTIQYSIYCSRDCYNKDKETKEQVCIYCGKTFKAKNWHRQLACSKECRTRAAQEKQQRMNEQKQTELDSRTCVICGSAIHGGTMQSMYCSDECRRQRNNQILRERYVRKEKQTFTKRCDVCGSSFETHSATAKYCSDPCRKKYQYKGFKPHKRNELVALIKRDGLKCQLCNENIDMSRIGLFGVSIDHIVPRSKGGTDELENLRLTHCICNALRGADEEKNEIDLEELEKYKARE